MTIGQPTSGAPDRTEPLPRTPLGPLVLLAGALAPVLVLLGGVLGRTGWLPVALGLLGVALLIAASYAMHLLRGSFADEIAEQPNLAVSLGDTWTRWLYYTLLLAAYLVLLGLAALVPWTLIVLLTVPLLGFPVWHVATGAFSGYLTQVVRDTALVALQYGGLIGLAFVLA